ncbi:MAG: carboxypeptidase-like regulatory domain-containing protein [Pyrinomonadaceae bacterium]
MKKLTTILLAGLLVAASVLLVTARVGQAQKQEDADVQRLLPIPKGGTVVTAVLAGRLLDSGGIPISGALVDCTGPSGTTGYVTGADGAYRFSLSQSGHYIIQPYFSGFTPGQAEFDVVVPGADFVRF